MEDKWLVGKQAYVEYAVGCGDIKFMAVYSKIPLSKACQIKYIVSWPLMLSLDVINFI